MAGKHDGMRYALGRARLTGSMKTVHNHKKEASRFVDTLRRLGLGVQNWKNITNKHVAMVVTQWQADGYTAGYIKNLLSGVRAICRAYGNDRIHEDNSAFGVERRVYVTNRDKSVPDEVYDRVVATLRAGTDSRQGRLALMLEYERILGLRFEEACKFNPVRDHHGDQIHIHAGTKGNRPRWEPVWNDLQQDVLERGKASGYYRSMANSGMPKGLSEKQWRNYVYRALDKLGLTKKACGGTMHGLRHAYCHERYEDLTGFNPPVKFDSREAWAAQAEAAAGLDWQIKDDYARTVIREEMGHGVGRDDIDGQYLGKW